MTESSTERRLSTARPTPLDLVSFLPYACNQLQAPFTVQIVCTIQDDYVSKGEEKSKKCIKVKSGTAQTSRTQHESPVQDESDQPTGQLHFYDDTIIVNAVFDTSDRLLELSFNRCPKLPRLLAKIIAICIPYQNFLYKMTIRWVPIEGESIYEIANFLPQSNLTDICLDDSRVPERNYYLLFDHPQLKRLSLARCNIDDDDCVLIASKLVHPLPAARYLLILSLVTNYITDVGAAALAEALRSNRSLQYLNLSGNQISDVGASAIFCTLMQFYLTPSELMLKRHRFMDYLRLKRDIFEKCLKELTTSSKEKSRDEISRGSKRKTISGKKKSSVTALALEAGYSYLDAVAFKAEIMTNELVGIYSDPFSIDEIENRDENVYSLGNTTLCYLNLSYNKLGYPSLVVLADVLKYQSMMTQKCGSGLLRVLIEGNDLPVMCPQYYVIDELLDKAIMLKIAKPPKQRERAKTKVK